MESNKRRKKRERKLNEGQLDYYKALRKQQKKKRKAKKNEHKELAEQPKTKRAKTLQVETIARPRGPMEDVELERANQRELKVQDSEKLMSRGKIMVRMVSAASKKLKETAKIPKPEKPALGRTESKPKVPKGVSSSLMDLKEIDPSNLKRERGARSIGSGTFGTCYLGKYRGISVVIKEYKERSLPGKTAEHKLSVLQREARHEARVLQKLGDHPGIPLLFGVCLKTPVSIIMKFHGDGQESLTVHKAARKKIIKEKKDWNRVICAIADALEHIHRFGYIHNDLKSNNVVLERHNDDRRLHPVIIDFGKSVAMAKARKPCAKPTHLKEYYKDSYIAPELVDGIGKPSEKSDVFAFAFLIKTVYQFAKLENIDTVQNALAFSVSTRPAIAELKAALSADD